MSNKCDSCRYNSFEWHEEPCDSCCGAHSGYEPKDEEEEREKDEQASRMDDLISKLSEIRSEYNCFDEDEEQQYRALSEMIKILSQLRKL